MTTEEGPSNASPGKWPSWLKQLGWDFLPKRAAPENSGLEVPSFDPPDWIDRDVALEEDVLATAQAEHKESVARAEGAESKGYRLFQTSVGLLVLTLGLAGFQTAYLRDEASGVLPFILILPTAGALVCLALAGIEALEIDRVGFYWPPVAQDVAVGDVPRRRLVEAELRASYVAYWTSGQKINLLVQARAWFSRGIVLLIVGAVVAVAMVTVRPADEERVSPTSVPSKGPVSQAEPLSREAR